MIKRWRGCVAIDAGIFPQHLMPIVDQEPHRQGHGTLQRVEGIHLIKYHTADNQIIAMKNEVKRDDPVF